MRYYVFDAGSTANEVVFAYAMRRGSAVMYVSKSQEPERHNRYTYQYKSWAWFHIPHTVARYSSDWPADNKFYIGMYSVTDATYRLMARSNDHVHMLLRDGIPQNDRLNPHEYHYFKYQLDDEDCDLSIQLTPISGDPDLYVSHDYPFPNSTTAEYSSTHTRLQKDFVSINNATGVYYVGVRGFTNTTFTILASEACGNNTLVIELSDGIPTQGFLHRGEDRLYRFRVTGPTEEISFAVSALDAGDPDLYISRQRFWDASGAEASYTTHGSDFVSIKKSDTIYCTSCDYYVLITAAMTTSYSLTVSTGNHTYIILQDGIPVEEDLESRSYEYFQLSMDAVDQDLTVVVTDLARGDPDLYISATNEHPSRHNYTWKSNTIGADAITIAASDPNACGTCRYFISVYAYTHTHMSIVAAWGGATLLRDGEPQAGYVAKHGMNYYQFTAYGGDHEDVTIQVSTIAGKVDVYVSQTEKPLRGNTTTYQFFRPHTVSQKMVTVRRGEDHHCQTVEQGRFTQKACIYYVGVWGYTGGNFSIIASTNHAVTSLQNGIPVKDHVGGGLYAYFTVSVLQPASTLSILLTPLTGDPDLYVSTRYQYPNKTQATTYTRRSRGPAGDSIQYDNADIGTYYIGVYGFRYSEFTIKALLALPNTTNSSSADCSILLDGSPQLVTMGSHHWRCFLFNVQDETGEVTFTASRFVGDPDLYIGHQFMPNKTHFTLHSIRYGDDFVALHQPELGTYYIGIYSYTATSFSITAATSTVTRTLQENIPVSEMLNKHESLEFIYDASDFTRDVSFVVTPLSGDPDLNVTLHGKSYRSRYWLEDSVTVPHTEVATLCQKTDEVCRFHVKVDGYTASRFTLTVSTGNSTVLQNGVPQAGTVHRNQYSYFRFETPPQKEIVVTATPTSGRLQVYVGYGDNPPTDVSHLYKAAASLTVETIKFVSGEHGGCLDDGDDMNNCVYTIGVRGMSRARAGHQGAATQFNLLVRSTDYEAVLQEGIAVHGWAMQHTALFYRFDVPNRGKEVIFQLTKITGDPDLYIARFPHPTRNHYEHRSLHFGSDGIVIPYANATSYYIGVYAFQNASYTLSVQVGNRTSSVIELIDGVPQSGAIAKHDHRPYRFTLAEPTDKLIISLSVEVGDPDLNVTLRGTARRWVARRYGADVVVIDGASNGTYNIDVYGFQDAIYVLTVATQSTGVHLSDGIPVRGHLEHRKFDYYTIYVDRTDMDLTVTVTAFDGDPDLYLSDSVTQPGPQNHRYNYSARLYGEDAITVPRQSLHRGYYYVSVYAPLNNVSYSVMSTFSNQSHLLDGTPQAGQLPTEAGKYYVFKAPRQHVSIQFALTIYGGHADIFVSTTGPPDPWKQATYNWRSHSQLTAGIIDINTNDPDYKLGFDYYILVHSYSNCSYAVVARTSTAVTSLQAGVPQPQSGLANETVLFTIEQTNAHQHLQLALTLQYGAVEVLISSHSSEGPWHWRRSVTEQPVIDISPSEPFAVLGTYYVAVVVKSQAQFTILAYAYNPDVHYNNSGILLGDGSPQLMVLKNTGDVRHFRFSVDGYEDVSVSLTPRYGNPDLYITLDGRTPTMRDYDRKSTTEAGDDLSFNRNELLRACSSARGTCAMAIAVIATTPSLCSVTATTHDRATILEPGQTYTAKVLRNEYRDFVVFVENEPTLTIEVVPVSGGDPDLYLHSSPHPNATHYLRKSELFGPDTISINTANSKFYYVSVRGAISPVTFRLTASLESRPTTLVDGYSQNGFVQKGHSRLYVYDLGAKSSSATTLSVHGFDGEAVLYISNTSHPSVSNHKWTTQAAAGRQRGVVTIPASATCAATTCRLFISVVGTASTHFSLLGTSGSQGTLLTYGQSIRGSLGKNSGNWRTRYLFLIDDNSTDVSLFVTTFSGAVDVFVSPMQENPNPNRHNSKYSGSYGSQIHRPVEIRHGIPGVYAVGVFPRDGNVTAQYSITATAENVMLQLGVPQTGTLTASGSLFFCLTKASEDLEVSVTSNDPSNPMMYRVYAAINTTRPHADDHDFSKVIRDGETFNIAQVDVKSCSRLYSNSESCIVYLAVYPFSSQNINKGFAITASTPDGVTVLQNRRQKEDGFDASKSRSPWKYYETYVPEQASRFVVELEPCVGEADLFVDMKASKPTTGAYTWKADRKGMIKRVDVTQRSNFETSYYIGVHAAEGSTEIKYHLRGSIEFPCRPINVTQTPSDPALAVDYDSEGVPIVSWDPKGLNALYFSVYTWKANVDFNGLIAYTACGLQEGVTRKQVKKLPQVVLQGTSEKKAIRITDIESGTHYVNIMAHTPDGNDVVYQAAIVKIGSLSPNPSPSPKSNNSSVAIILGIGIPLVVICIAAIVYLSVKNRQLTQELQIEMHDVPKSIDNAFSLDLGSSERPATASQKYSRLLSEVEDDEKELVGGDFSELPEV
uniref:Uncharacterized protein n=1 Tax=Lotharella globosa TaxID=91324 RepID=A0A7S4DNT6_9EUKA